MKRTDFINHFKEELENRQIIETPTPNAWNIVFQEGHARLFLENLGDLNADRNTEGIRQHIASNLSKSLYTVPLDDTLMMFVCITEEASKVISESCKAIFHDVIITEINTMWFVSARNKLHKERN